MEPGGFPGFRRICLVFSLSSESLILLYFSSIPSIGDGMFPNRGGMVGGERDATVARPRFEPVGMQWNALNATGICSCSSAYRRFREWAEAGVFCEFWRQGLLAYDQKHGIEWEWLAMDGALGKAPLGGELTGPNPTDRAKKGRNDRSSPRARASRSGSRQRART